MMMAARYPAEAAISRTEVRRPATKRSKVLCQFAISAGRWFARRSLRIRKLITRLSGAAVVRAAAISSGSNIVIISTLGAQMHTAINRVHVSVSRFCDLVVHNVASGLPKCLAGSDFPRPPHPRARTGSSLPARIRRRGRSGRCERGHCGPAELSKLCRCVWTLGNFGSSDA